MKRIWVLALAVAAVGLLPATAAAKEVKGIAVCGASGCKDVADVQAWVDEGRAASLQTFDAPVGPYYSLEIRFGDAGQVIGTHTMYWLAGTRLVHGADQSSFDPWSGLTGAQTAALRIAAAGMKPFTPALSRVVVAGKVVADPSSYIRLFGHFRTSYVYAPNDARWVTIKVKPAHPNPWLSKTVTLRYQPQLRLLMRPDFEEVALPKALGQRLVRRSGSHTALFAGVGAAVFAGLAALAVLRRKRTNRNERREP